MSNPPPRPTDLEIWLVNNIVSGVDVQHVQTGDDTSETYVVLRTGERSKNKQRVLRSTLMPLIDYHIDWVAALRPTSETVRRVEEWKSWAKRYAAELATYERLRKKFEGGDR